MMGGSYEYQDTVPSLTSSSRESQARQSHILPPLPYFQNGLQAKTGFEMCFDIGSQHVGCWAKTRLQNKEVRANSISAMRFPYYPFLEERAMLGVIYDAVVGAGAKTRPRLCPIMNSITHYKS